MERRDFIGQAAILAASSAAILGGARTALGAEKKKGGHDHAHMGEADPKTAALQAAANDCVQKGESCVQHCMESLSTGDTQMAACAKSVREMLIYCRALTEATARKSKHLKDLAKIALKSCEDCEKECRKHEEMAVCKACMDSCIECAKACKAVVA